MRLKEPLFGLRVAQMHFVIHFCLFFNQVILDNKIQNDLDYYRADMNETTNHSPDQGSSLRSLTVLPEAQLKFTAIKF